MKKPSNTMVGRHGVGGQTARPGGIRGGQAEPAGNKGGGITGVSPASPSRSMKARPPVLTDQARTSAGAQRIIPRPPMPFENPHGSANVPAPANRNFQKAQTASLPSKGMYGTAKGGNNVSEVSILKGTETTPDMLAAVGEPAKPKGYNSIISGYPTKPARQVGRPGNSNTGTSRRENARMRQTGY